MLTRTPVLGDPAFAAVPLTVEDGSTFGALVINFAEERDFNATDVSFLRSLATQAAQAFHRARLLEEAAAAAERMAFLSEAAALLNASLDMGDTLAALADLAVPRLGHWCTVHLVDEAGRPVPVAVAHTDPEKRRLGWELQRRWPPQPGTPSAVIRAVTEGTSALFQVVPQEMLRQVARDDDHYQVLTRLGFGSGMVVPLTSRGRVLGVLSLANEVGRIITEAEFALARDLAGRAGAAVANAQLFAERSRVARSLQASLLPAALPRVEGIEFGARYLAAGAGLDVGGDFYDVFAVEGGWGVAIGEVCGKGVDAAAVTGMARHTIRAIAGIERSPRAMLLRLNEVLLSSADDAGWGAGYEQRFCTVAAARVELVEAGGGVEGAGARVVISSGGHPLPLVRRRGGAIERPVARGDMLGVLPSVELVDTVVTLGPGDLMVLFTDGITERHEGAAFFGEEGIAEVLSSPEVDGLGAGDVAAVIERAARRFVEREVADDMAVLVLRVPA